MELCNAALRKDVATLKEVDYGAVAKRELQHQKDIFELRFKRKDVEIDLAVKKRTRAGLEVELTAARKTVDKLRGKIDDMYVDQVKTGKSIAVMAEKSQMQNTEKTSKSSSFRCSC